MVTEGKLKIDSSQPDYFVFKNDVAFASPSAGAAVVNAGNMNGRTMWKTKAGETYQQWHEKKLAAAGELGNSEEEQ